MPSFPSFTTSNGIDFTLVCTDGGAFISYDQLDNVSNISPIVHRTFLKALIL
ncbi:MAG: hypothetical protein AAFQ87_25095 [Bacteroidota bacterium]